MRKSDLRKFYKSKRKSFTKLTVEQKSQKIFEHLKTLDIWDYETYHIFLPIESQLEVNTRPIIDALFLNNKTVVLPKIKGDSLINCKVNKGFETELKLFNVPEPRHFEIIASENIDVVFVPLLISDLMGNRVGYGGGFYDRFLSACSKNTIKVGLNFFSSIPLIEDVLPSDIPLDYCVTTSGIESF